MKELTKEEEIERATGIIAFCKGKTFNINKSPAWARGWKEMANKFRSAPQKVQCSVITGMDRQCMRAATIGDLCAYHAKMPRRKLKFLSLNGEQTIKEG